MARPPSSDPVRAAPNVHRRWTSARRLLLVHACGASSVVMSWSSWLRRKENCVRNCTTVVGSGGAYPSLTHSSQIDLPVFVEKRRERAVERRRLLEVGQVRSRWDDRQLRPGERGVDLARERD